MFDRRLYKKKALSQLKGRWLFPIIITFVTSLLVVCLALPLVRNADIDISAHGSNINAQLSTAPTLLLTLGVAICGILGTANLGVYLRLSRTESGIDFSLFLRGLERWLGGALGALWFALWTSLWSLLFFIPGIVKALSYSQMFFIIAEYPRVSVRRAMNISKIMTQGHKADLFVQAVSFAGWMFLCALTCGLGWLVLAPYMQQTFTNSYVALKNEALATGRVHPADFAD